MNINPNRNLTSLYTISRILNIILTQRHHGYKNDKCDVDDTVYNT